MPPPPNSSVIYLGAALEDEISYEFLTEDGVVHGALTYFLSRGLRRAKPGTTYQHLFEEITSEIVARFPSQHPSLEGNASQLLPGANRASTSVVVVTNREERTVTINIGAAAGVTTQSLWAVYPAQTDAANSKADKLGTIEIADVRGADALARIVSESHAAAIVPGVQAVEEAHNYGEMRLRLAIHVPGDDAQPAERLADALRTSDLLRIVKLDEVPDVVVLQVPQGANIEVDTSGSRSSFHGPMWILQDNQSRPLQSRPFMVAASRIHDLRYELEKLAKYWNLFSLVNPNLRSPLVGNVDLILKHRARGAWVVPETEPKKALPMLYEGEEVRLEIRNNHTESIYASVFDFGLSMTIQPLSPLGQRVDPGKTIPLALNDEPETGLQLFIPPEFPGLFGVECLKLFATTYPTDLEAMFLQQGVRGVKMSRQGSLTELWQLMDMALTGRGSRERRTVQLPVEQEWATAKRAFELRRREP